MSASRPNVLLIMGDEHPVFMNGCYGHKVAKTPTLDALAESGVIFDAAYCPSPLCAPSRAAMMTGRHVHKIEVWDNAAPLRSDWPTFAHSFSAAGYRTILSGKMHFVGPDQYHGFEERLTQEIFTADFRATQSYRNQVAVNANATLARVYQTGMGWSVDMDYDEEVCFRTECCIRQMTRISDTRPFLLCVSFTGPHMPYYAPEKYWNLYNDSDIELPDIPEDYERSDPEHVRWLRKHHSLNHLVPDEVCRSARRATLGRITMVDDYIGRIISLLKKTGLYENTIIVYTSDHGDMMGEHGLWYKSTPYEWASRVPLIVAGPGIGHRRVQEPVSTLAMGSTLCSLAGIEPVYPVCDADDFAAYVKREAPAERGTAIVEYYGEGTRKGWRMVRKGQYKLVYLPEDSIELYDLEADPNEWNNVASDPANVHIVNELKADALRDWDHKRADEMCWQSEERRLAVLKAPHYCKGWDAESPPLLHPLRDGRGAPIGSISLFRGKDEPFGTVPDPRLQQDAANT